jgi:uncharacterized protein YkwD
MGHGCHKFLQLVIKKNFIPVLLLNQLNPGLRDKRAMFFGKYFHGFWSILVFRMMRREMVKIFLLLLISACVHTNTSSEVSNASALDQDTAGQFLALINEHRKEIGAPLLSLNDQLSTIALGHSTNMANETVDFGHTGFSGRCTDARNAVNGGNLCAENVAMGQKTARAVFDAWMDSPGHRANMEQARFTHMGIAYKQNRNGTFYWTQILVEKN